MTYQSKITKIKNTLTNIEGLNVGHFAVMDKGDRYCVWAERSEIDSIYGDDKKIEFTLEGTIDYFTKHENDPFVELIVEALTEDGYTFELNSAQYEDETEFIHYEWIWQV